VGLRELRERRAMTLRDLVAKSGVSMQTLVDLEHGRTAPQPRTLRRLAEAFEMSAEEMYDVVQPKARRRTQKRGERA
jgi:transcriptional regulator with XRE-family HTH domain